MTNPRSYPPSVSVILPTFNREDLIERSIASVLNQTHADFNLVVVDDGSSDGTLERMRSFGDPRIRTIRLDENRGAAAARNAGIRASTSPFLAFQDSDDEWLPTKLERQLQVFATSGPEVGIVYCDMERVWQNGRVDYHHSPDVLSGQLLNPETMFYQVCSLGIQSTVIRRECLEQVGDFNEAFPALEDLELFIRLSRRYAFHHLAEPLVRYHETLGLSKNEPAKQVARRLLLEIYGDELRRENTDFVMREAALLGVTAAGSGTSAA